MFMEENVLNGQIKSNNDRPEYRYPVVDKVTIIPDNSVPRTAPYTSYPTELLPTPPRSVSSLPPPPPPPPAMTSEMNKRADTRFGPPGILPLLPQTSPSNRLPVPHNDLAIPVDNTALLHSGGVWGETITCFNGKICTPEIRLVPLCNVPIEGPGCLPPCWTEHCTYIQKADVSCILWMCHLIDQSHLAIILGTTIPAAVLLMIGAGVVIWWIRHRRQQGFMQVEEDLQVDNICHGRNIVYNVKMTSNYSG